MYLRHCTLKIYYVHNQKCVNRKPKTIGNFPFWCEYQYDVTCLPYDIIMILLQNRFIWWLYIWSDVNVINYILILSIGDNSHLPSSPWSPASGYAGKGTKRRTELVRSLHREQFVIFNCLEIIATLWFFSSILHKYHTVPNDCPF